MWNPGQYEKFKSERSQPFFDLVDLVRSKNPKRVIDLGCGTGELTKILHEKIGAASTLGIDSSAEMLSKAPRDVPGLAFERQEIEGFFAENGEPFDLIFSNAALHWVENHGALFERLARRLAPRGEIAIQMPANFDHVSHVLAEEVARMPRFASASGGFVRKPPVLAPERYAELLDRAGFEEQSVRLQVYAHHLESRDGLVEWVKGTLLTAYSAKMSAEMYAEFLAEYTRLLSARVEDRRPFFYPFKRILLRAKKS